MYRSIHQAFQAIKRLSSRGEVGVSLLSQRQRQGPLLPGDSAPVKSSVVGTCALCRLLSFPLMRTHLLKPSNVHM